MHAWVFTINWIWFPSKWTFLVMTLHVPTKVLSFLWQTRKVGMDPWDGMDQDPALTLFDLIYWCHNLSQGSVWVNDLWMSVHVSSPNTINVGGLLHLLFSRHPLRIEETEFLEVNHALDNQKLLNHWHLSQSRKNYQHKCMCIFIIFLQ